MKRLRLTLLLVAGLVACGVGTAGATPAPPLNPDWLPLENSPVDSPQVVTGPAGSGEVYRFGRLAVEHSTDNGATWRQGQPACLNTETAFDPNSPETLYNGCAGGSFSGVMRSDNGGATWYFAVGHLADGTIMSAPIAAVAVAGTTPSTVYAVSDDAPPSSEMYRSRDGGATWDHMTVPLVYDPVLAVDPAHPEHVAMTGDVQSGGAITTDDGGDTWTSHPGPALGQIGFDSNDPQKLWAITLAGGLVESPDFGVTWIAVPGSPQGLQRLALAPGMVYLAGTGGLSRSTDDGATWNTVQLVVAPQTMQFTSVAVDPDDPDHVFVEAKDSTGIPDGLWSTEFSDTEPATSSYALVQLGAPIDVTPTSATLTGTVAALMPVSYGFAKFAWGVDPAHMTWAAQTIDPSASHTDRPVTQEISGLSPGTTYHVQLSGGFEFPLESGEVQYTPEITFTTPAAVLPGVTSGPATTLANGQVTDGRIPVNVSWTRAAGTFPVAGSHLSRSVDGGAWAPVARGKPTSAATTLALGHSYRFRAQAVDSKGHAGAWRAGPAGTLKLKDDAGTQAVWSGSWMRKRDTTAVDKTLHTSSAGAAGVTLRFTGRSVAVIAPRGAHLASFSAMMDGKSVGKITPSATFTTGRRTVAIYSFTGAASHTLVLHVVRSSGHTLAELDAFAVLG